MGRRHGGSFCRGDYEEGESDLSHGQSNAQLEQAMERQKTELHIAQTALFEEEQKT